MSEIKSYKDLIVWQKSIEMVTDVYKLINLLPKNEEYALASQMRRCAVSIPSNIAEGTGRYYLKDYVRFLQISRGSVYELQTQIIIAQNLGYISDLELTNCINSKLNEVEKMLNKMISNFINELSKEQNQTKNVNPSKNE